jgi:peptidoglycan lytic transglycosylase
VLTGHENASPCAAASGFDAPWERPVAPGRATRSPHRGSVIRTLVAIVGLVGLLCVAIPDVSYGGSPQAAQVGFASWYGKPHEGRKTASGERFSRGQLTAAHRSLPLGTKVQVTNLRTQQHVVVKINDRGPYGGGKRRIIDLSEAAAQRVGLQARGTERVQVVVVERAS